MQHVVRVKVCGITTREDASLAISLGADALGFLVGLIYASEDELAPDEAGKIVDTLPPFVPATLVTHRTEVATVRDLCVRVRPQTLQLHGAFPIERIPELRETFPALKIIKAVHVDGGDVVGAAVAAMRYADAVLLDTKTAARIGGTGVTHDWSVSRRVRDGIAPSPVVLAGGLNPGNVARAIEQVQPYAVDVNSGVSIRRGKKSPELIAAFVRAAKQSLVAPEGR
jgi:phosphoribosylanthranilate isomerase